jgi:hypothetical protein
MRATRLIPLAALVAVAASPLACHGGSSTASVDAAATISPQPGPPPSAPAHATPIPIASIEAYVNPAHLPAYDGPTGSVEGTIRVEGPSAPDRKGLEFGKCRDAGILYGKLFREGSVAAADGSRTLADAVVAVTGYSGFYVPERADAVAVKIDGCAFDAKTVAMTFGQRLEITSSASEIWAPTLTQAPLPALMVVNSHTDSVKLYPPHPGYFTLVDTTLAHSYASVDVYAMLQPLHAVSGVDGHYRIDGVPVGKMKVNAHLAAIQRDASADIEVTKGAVQHADLVLHYVPALSGPPDGGFPDNWKK